MIERLRITDIQKISHRTVFFDANIFVYIFWPCANDHNTSVYSTFFKKCLEKEIPITTNIIVVSEIVNRIFRIEYEKYLKKNNLDKGKLPFKQYRNSRDGLNAQDDIYAVIKAKLTQFSICPDAYDKNSIFSFLSSLNTDFNDCAISHTCKKNNYVLVTNDADFSTAEIPIISANSKFF